MRSALLLNLARSVERGPGLEELPEPDMARSIRRKAGVTSIELGDAVGVCNKSIERWELGIRKPQGRIIRERYGRALAFLKDVVE